MNNEQKTLCEKLTKILGYTKFSKISEACNGSWSGTTDYSLRFDGTKELFISNGRNRFLEKVNEYIQYIQTFQQYKEEMFKTICKQVERDNQIAEQEGLLPVKCISLDINRNQNHFLWPCVRLEVSGNQFDFCESTLHYCIYLNRLKEYFLKKNTLETYTAGAVKEPTFVFGNVRFSHLDKLYKA